MKDALFVPDAARLAKPDNRAHDIASALITSRPEQTNDHPA